MNLSDYRIWNEIVRVVDDETLYRIASADNYAPPEEWKNNHQRLREIVKTSVLPIPLEFNVAEGATFFNIGFVFRSSEVSSFLFCSVLLLAIHATQVFDAGDLESDLIIGVDCSQRLGAQWLALYLEYLEQLESERRFGELVLPYFGMARLITGILIDRDQIYREEALARIRRVFAANHEFCRCACDDLSGLYLRGRCGSVWKWYLEKTGLVGWINETR